MTQGPRIKLSPNAVSTERAVRGSVVVEGLHNLLHFRRPRTFEKHPHTFREERFEGEDRLIVVLALDDLRLVHSSLTGAPGDEMSCGSDRYQIIYSQPGHITSHLEVAFFEKIPQLLHLPQGSDSDPFMA
jgi:hypothetical protein